MRKKLVYLFLFGIAFGFVEAAVVFYLRQLIGYSDGYSVANIRVLLNLGVMAFIEPSKEILKFPSLGVAESFREVATLLMLLAVALLSAEKLKLRVGAFLIAFSLWDLFYYIFLKILTGWPKSFFDIDIYFLIPVPWIGPVITPVVISLILLILGVKFYLKDGRN